MPQDVIRNILGIMSRRYSQLLKQIGKAGFQVPPSPLEKVGERLSDHGYRHAEQQDNRSRPDENVESFKHGPPPAGWKNPVRIVLKSRVSVSSYQAKTPKTNAAADLVVCD
jgi:hypothetical protein